MIELILKGQKLAVNTPLLVAGSVDYLTIQIHRDSEDWKGLALHIFFQKARGATYELLTEGDFIGTDAHLDLSEGEWSVSVIGYAFENDTMVEKITTNTIGLTVAPAPPDAGASLPGTPQTAFEQVEAIARSVRADADAGLFKGEKGDKGDTALTFAVGEVTTGAAGSSAEVEDVGSDGDIILNFKIPKGDSGADITVASTSVQYKSSSSGTTPPSGTWSDSVPTVAQGNFLWSRTIVEYSDGVKTVSYSVSRMGVDGSGSVASVNNVGPDGSGNVTLDAEDVGALPDSYTPPVTSVNGQTGAVSLDAGDVGAASLVDSKVDPDEASSAIVTTASSLTLALTHSGKLIRVNTSTAATVTIPAASSVLFPVGTEIEIVAYGTGTVSIAGAAGVTLLSMDGLTDIAGQYGVVCLKKIETNTWLLAGALA